MRAFRIKTSASIHGDQVTAENVEQMALWCGGVIVETQDPFDSSKKRKEINVPTIGGIVRASHGDYVIKNQFGQIDVHKQGKFEQIYEPL